MSNYLDVKELPVIQEPSEMLILKMIDNLNGIVNAYKEYKIANTVEATKRVACREQAKVAIKALEEETKRYIYDSNTNKELAFEMIHALSVLLENKEIIDENTYNICKMLIEKAAGAMR